mmetsp:Transcript_25992/g.46869  ORF Transcript_25992/g.46869 Transcript_25992/m.46869 type:complete len:246 (+) Transcript_25992:72-809(+)
MSQNNEYTKRLRKSTIKQVINDLLIEKITGVGGKIERNSYEEKITSLALMGVMITPGALYKRVSREYINLKRSAEVVVNANTTPGNEVSRLTSPSSAIQEEVDDDDEVPPEMGSRGGGDSDDESDYEPDDESDDESDDEAVPSLSRPKADRPLGNTDDEKREDAKKLKDCISAVACDYATEITSRKAEGKKRVMKGFLTDLINKKRDEFGVVVSISEETIRSRAKRRNKDSSHPGKNRHVCPRPR